MSKEIAKAPAKRVVYTYQFIRHYGDQFGGLWDLYRCDNEIRRKVVDADSLTSCLAHVQREFEVDGY